MTSVLISTVIPTIGRASLARTVESVLAQNIGAGKHEVIVVNDSGAPFPPASWQTDPRVQVVTSNRSERSMACNVGVALARGKYVNFVHDDDYLLPGALASLLACAETAPPDAVWFYGGLNRVSNEDEFQSVDFPGPEVSGNIFALFVVQECLHVSNSLLRRDAFLRAGGFDTRLSMREDLDLEVRLSLMGTFARTDAIVAGIRVGEAGSTSNWSTFKEYSFLVRERTVGHPQAWRRLQSSLRTNAPLRGNLFLRGRLTRAYWLTGAVHLRAGHGILALSRFGCGLYLAGWRLLSPAFWQGCAYPSAPFQPRYARSSAAIAVP